MLNKIGLHIGMKIGSLIFFLIIFIEVTFKMCDYSKTCLKWYCWDQK
jgi:hypothetical protein